MDELRLDVLSFLRLLRRRPGLSFAVVMILALGMAASVTVFSVVEALVLDPFPYPEPSRLVVVGTEMPRVGKELGYFERLSGPEAVDIEQRGQALERLLPFDLNSVRVRGSDFPRRLFALFTSADPFLTLGLEPVVGRGFVPEELAQNARVAVISHEFWQNEYGGDPFVLGRTLIVDGTSYTLIGVVPAGGSIFGADLWLPLAKPIGRMERASRHLNLMARLAPGVDLATANAELKAVADAVALDFGAEFDEYDGWRLAATTWNRFNAFAFEDESILVLGTMVFVWLLICANLANLLLTRAASRQGEVAVRLALGASRERIVQQAMTESALFALCGGVVGMLLGSWGLEAVASWLPSTLQPVAKPIAFDRETWGFALGTIGLAAIFCGLPSAFFLARARLRDALVGESRASSGLAVRRGHRALVVAQVAVAAVLLAGAGGLVWAWSDLARQDLGFRSEQLVSMRLSLPRNAYEGEAVSTFFAGLEEELISIPGVGEVSIATQVAPYTFFGAELELATSAADEPLARPFHTVVGDGYFQAFGIELLRGRVFSGQDRFGGPCALVVNELAASRYFPGQDPLGQRVRVRATRFDSGWCEVVGVVATIRNQGLAQPAAPEIFTSHRQAGGRYNQMFVVARTRMDPEITVAAIRDRVRRLDPDQPIYSIFTVDEALTDQVAPRRVTAQLLTAFAIMALCLASLGIYAVVSFGVTARRQEMGIRLAYGARRRDLAGLVIRESLQNLSLGLAIGLTGIGLLASWLSNRVAFLGEVDLWVGIVPLIPLALSALLAAALPALRAGSHSPSEILRRL